MKKYIGEIHLGIRNRDTRELIAVYPHKVDGNEKDVDQKVFDWYYKQNCGAEEILRNSYVDALTEQESKSLK